MILLTGIILTACAAASPWSIDSITTGEKKFDSIRIIYANSAISPLCFEIIQLEGGVEAFLSLSKFKLNTTLDENRIKPHSAHHPKNHYIPEDKDLISAQFDIDGEKWQELVPLLEGRMKVRLSSEITQRLIEALQEGKKVVILVDGFEQTIVPERFSKLYEKFGDSKSH